MVNEKINSLTFYVYVGFTIQVYFKSKFLTKDDRSIYSNSIILFRPIIFKLIKTNKVSKTFNRLDNSTLPIIRHGQ